MLEDNLFSSRQPGFCPAVLADSKPWHRRDGYVRFTETSLIREQQLRKLCEVLRSYMEPCRFDPHLLYE